jgi:tagatose 6-phosphate kinase
MILTVTLNAALDVTYEVEHQSHGEPVRVRRVMSRSGGKGINVAFVLSALGTGATVTGLAGGRRGQVIREGLANVGITEALFPIAGESRQTVVVAADDGSVAAYHEPGPVVLAAEWEQFLVRYNALLSECSSVVCAGSLPTSIPDDAYAILIEAAHRQRRTVVLDASGVALRRGLEAEPDVVKVSHAEFSELAGTDLTDEASILSWAKGIKGDVIVTLGAEGAIACGDGWRWRVHPPKRSGNPVGAGDAFTAGLVCDDMIAAGPRDRLIFATALAASSVGLPGAGLIDLDLARDLADEGKVVVM